MATWWQKLFGRSSAPDPIYETGDLQLVPSSVSVSRVEAAMPGTSALTPLLQLDPPPVDPDLKRPDVDDDTLRDYGPDPIAEAIYTIPADRPFDCSALANELMAIVPKGARHPTHYVVTPQGQTTYLTSADAPEMGTSLIIGWSFWEGNKNTPDQIEAQANLFADMLRKRPEGFQVSPLNVKDVHARYAAAQQIIEVGPVEVTICARRPDVSAINGKLVWNTLHRLGFRWGDMDCFQWVDPTDQTDYLIWVETDDHQLGYALPEEISAGRQNFFEIRFSVNLLRTPLPAHVIGEMLRAATRFADETDTTLSAFIDGQSVDTPETLLQAAQTVIDQLASLGTKPGATSVCMLR